MPRRGENIYKRKDGRWEGRLIRGHHPNGKAIYQYVYGKSYSEAKRKLLDLRSRRNVGADTVNQRVKYKDILNEWLIMSQIRTKESTFHIIRTFQSYISCLSLVKYQLNTLQQKS